MFVGGGVGESACGAKAACRRRQALPGCCAALPKYKTIVTAWRLRQLLKGRRRESKPPFERLERFFPAGGFLEVTSTAARTSFFLCAVAGAFFFPFAVSDLQNSPFTGTVSGRFLNGQAFGFGLGPFPPFPAIFKSSLRPPRRRGPSFCVDRKKAKSDQGCALDPDGQRRRSLCFGPFHAAQSAWTGVLRGAMIDVCFGGSMLGWAAAGGVGCGSQLVKWVVAPAPSLKLA